MQDTRVLKVETTFGTDAELWSDDTFTLHFGEGFEEQSESTPSLLAESVTRESLESIANAAGDANHREKAQAALECAMRG